jgi:hypothetical protein
MTRQEHWTISHFSQANPRGPGQGDVVGLLRRVADTIDELGDVTIQDITFAIEVTDAEDVVSMTVYYHDTPPRK